MKEERYGDERRDRDERKEILKKKIQILKEIG